MNFKTGGPNTQFTSRALQAYKQAIHSNPSEQLWRDLIIYSSNCIYFVCDARASHRLPDNPLRRRSMSVTASSLGSRTTPHHSPKSLFPSCQPDFCIHPGPVVHQKRVKRAFLSPAKRDKTRIALVLGASATCSIRIRWWYIYLYAHKKDTRESTCPHQNNVHVRARA